MKYRYEKTGLNKKKRTLRPESEWIPIPVPAIVDEATWQAAQKQLKDNKNLAKRNLKHDYLLNGLVTCAKCGRAMVISHSGCKKLISYYACLSQRSSSYIYAGQKPCTARQIPTKLLDDYVFTYLLKLFRDLAQIDEYIQATLQKQDIPKHKTAFDQIVKTEKELLEQKGTLLRWFRRKMLTKNEAENQIEDIQKQLADISQIKKTYQAALAAIPTCSVAEITSIINYHLHQANFTLEEKKTALRSVLDSVIVERIDHTRGRGSRPEINVQLKLK